MLPLSQLQPAAHVCMHAHPHVESAASITASGNPPFSNPPFSKGLYAAGAGYCCVYTHRIIISVMQWPIAVHCLLAMQGLLILHPKLSGSHQGFLLLGRSTVFTKLFQCVHCQCSSGCCSRILIGPLAFCMQPTAKRCALLCTATAACTIHTWGSGLFEGARVNLD